jgi:hypothetical protein
MIWEPDEDLKKLLSISFKTSEDEQDDNEKSDRVKKTKKVVTVDFFIHAEKFSPAFSPECLTFYGLVNYYQNLRSIKEGEELIFINL